jgi:hypothetical protein
MDKLDEKLEQDCRETKQTLEQDRKETKQDIQDMGGKLNKRMDILEESQNEMKNNIRKECQKVRKQIQDKTISKTGSEISRSKKRRIRKRRLLESLGINIINSIKSTKERKISQVRERVDQELVECKGSIIAKWRSI